MYKVLIVLALSVLLPALATAKGKGGGSVYVHSYTKSNGTTVEGHYRSAPNSTKCDNWSTTGNVNPYTGSVGTKNVCEGCSYPTYATPQAYTAPSAVYYPASTYSYSSWKEPKVQDDSDDTFSKVMLSIFSIGLLVSVAASLK